jgi:hypothetical protein
MEKIFGKKRGVFTAVSRSVGRGKPFWVGVDVTKIDVRFFLWERVPVQESMPASRRGKSVGRKKAVFEGNGGDELGKETIAVVGGDLVLDVDDVLVNGNIRVGVNNSGVSFGEGKSGSSVVIGSDHASVGITGDVAVSSVGNSLAVNMSGETSSFTGTVTEVMVTDDQGQDVVKEGAGTHFTAGDGATIHLTGDSTIQSVTSNGAVVDAGRIPCK